MPSEGVGLRGEWVVPFSSGSAFAISNDREKENQPPRPSAVSLRSAVRRARRVVVREVSPSSPLKVVDPSGAARLPNDGSAAFPRAGPCGRLRRAFGTFPPLRSGASAEQGFKENYALLKKLSEM